MKNITVSSPSKIEMLYSTIHQMSKSEKRSFRLEINKLKKNSHSEVVFDYLLTTKSLDIELFALSMSEKNVQNPQTLINYLFDKLLTHLSQVRLSINEYKHSFDIKQLIGRSETVFLLGFFQYAHKLRLKVLDLTYQYEEYHNVADSLIILDFMEKKYHLTGLSDILAKYSKGLSIEDSILHASKLQEIKFKVRFLLNKSVQFSLSKTTPNEWETLIDNEIFEMTHENIGYQSYLMLLRIKQKYCAYKQDTEVALAVRKQLIDLQETTPNFTIHAFIDFMMDHTFIHHHLLISSNIKLAKYTQVFNDLFEKWSDVLMDNVQDSQYNLYKNTHHVLNSVVQRKFLLTQKSFTLSDINDFEINKNGNLFNVLNVSHQLSRMLAIYLCLLIKEYNGLAYYKNLLANQLKKHNINNDIEWIIEMIYLIEYYENNHDTFFRNRLTNLYRKNQRKNTAPEIVAYMLQLIKRLSNKSAQNNKKKILREALPEAIQIESQSYRPILPFSKWIEWRIRE